MHRLHGLKALDRILNDSKWLLTLTHTHFDVSHIQYRSPTISDVLETGEHQKMNSKVAIPILFPTAKSLFILPQ